MPTEIHTVKKPVRKLEDLKGMKIACTRGPAKTLKALGAVPVVMPPADMYQSLEKGVVDGVAVAYGWFNNSRFYEVTNYHTNAHLGGITSMMIMNKKRWKSLSPDMQKIFNDYGPIGSKSMIENALKDKATGIKNAKKPGHEYITLSDQERARWVATAKPVWDAWAKKMEKKGLPGKKVLDRTVELVKKYSSQK